MRDILKMTGDLQAHISAEIDGLLAERAGMRDVLEARLKELSARREDELARIQQWAEQQKALVGEIFGALISETRADIEGNAALMARIGGDVAPRTRPPAPLKVISKAAEAFKRAAE